MRAYGKGSVTGREDNEDFYGAGNVLFLDLGASYTVCAFTKIHPAEHLRFVYDLYVIGMFYFNKN